MCRRPRPRGSVPQVLPSQPHCCVTNRLMLWHCDSGFVPGGILGALAGSKPYSQHYGWTTVTGRREELLPCT